MIAYHFPPEGSAGVYRPLRFVQHLPSMNWNISVISLDTNHYHRYDPGLLALVPKEIEISRVRMRDIWESIQARREQNLQQKMGSVSGETATRIHAAYNAPFRSRIREIVRKAEAWCYHPDMSMCWIRPATSATVKICARKRPNVIYATGGPWSSFIIAQRASRRTGIPYVLDFRDSWTITYNEFEARRPSWATRSRSASFI